MYKLIDNQGENGFGLTKELYENKKDIIDRLISFHESDFERTEEYVSLRKYTENYWNKNKKGNVIDKQLEAILDYGDWSIKIIKKKRKNL